MKNISNFILEKLKISKNTKINKDFDDDVLLPNEFKKLENIGINYNGEQVLVLGKPFKDRNDKNWEISMNFIQDNDFEIINGFDDIDNKEDFDYFVYACSEDNMEVYCYVYDSSGVLVYKN